MAIAENSNSGTFSGGTPGTSTLTIAATLNSVTNGYLLAFAIIEGNTNTSMSTLTWGGVAMTLLQKNETGHGAGADHNVYIYGLANPASGSANLVFTSLANTQFGIAGAWVLLSGANQITSPADALATGNLTGAGTSWATSITTVATNTAVYLLADIGTTVSASTNETSVIIDGTNGRLLAKSGTFPKTPAGAYVMTTGATTNAGNLCNSVAVSISTPIYPLTAAFGAYALTGEASLFHYVRKVVLVFGSYVLTGEAALFSLMRRWIPTLKSSTTYKNPTKHTTTSGHQTKKTTSWNNQTKNHG